MPLWTTRGEVKAWSEVRSQDNRLVGVGGMEGATGRVPRRLYRRANSELKMNSDRA